MFELEPEPFVLCPPGVEEADRGPLVGRIGVSAGSGVAIFKGGGRGLEVGSGVGMEVGSVLSSASE